MTVFFVPDPEGLGTLYWNEGTSTEPDAQRSLPLARVSVRRRALSLGEVEVLSFHMLPLSFTLHLSHINMSSFPFFFSPLCRRQDVFLGKQRDVFHYPAARDADVDCCFTIRSKRVELNLEAATPRERELWLNALRSVLQVRPGRPGVSLPSCATSLSC